jgi:hypothetical protein
VGDRALAPVVGRFDGQSERSNYLLFGLVDVALAFVAIFFSRLRTVAQLGSQ